MNFVIPTDKCYSSTTIAASLPVLFKSLLMTGSAAAAVGQGLPGLPPAPCRPLQCLLMGVAAPGCPRRTGVCHTWFFVLWLDREMEGGCTP